MSGLVRSMTLRDYFAAKALPESMQWKGTDKAEEVARMAYLIADAMLIVRDI